MNKNTISRKIMAAAMAILASGSAYSQCIDGNCDNGYGVMIFEEGDRYEGFFKNGDPNGFGTLTFNGGDFYVGQFKDGEFTGTGTYYWTESGEKYIGHWQNNERHGIGTTISVDGSVTREIWEMGKQLDSDEGVTGCINGNCKKGFGVYIYDDGSIYEGNWEKSYPNGQGKMTLKDGSVYEGEFSNGYYQGFGVLTKPDGSELRGLWDEDRYQGPVNPQTTKGDISGNTTNGYGIYVFDNSDYHMGYWKDDKPYGMGTQFMTSGLILEGSWENGQLNGFGTMRYPEDEEEGRLLYIGDMRNGKAEGYGAIVWKDGSVFYGQYKDNVVNGQAVLIDMDNGGVKQSGIWKDGKIVKEMDESQFDLIFGSKNGFGIKLTKDGRYAGNLRNGLPHGVGTMRSYSNGNTIAGNCFQNGEITGDGMLESPSGVRYVGQIKNGMAHGEGTVYYADGTSYTGKFNNGDIVKEAPAFKENVAKPEAVWNQPQLYETDTQNTKIDLELCVSSETNVKEIVVYVNGEVQYNNAPTRGFKVVKSQCDLKVTCKVELKPGRNEIYATVKNDGGITTTDKRYVTLKKNETISEEKRVALIIGNANYQSVTPLNNSCNDARLMSETLQQLGFECLTFTDVTRDDMVRHIKTFGKRLEETKGVGLFFYAGHGLQVDGYNYLVPVNATVEKKQDIEFECVNLQRLLGEFEYADNSLNIVILDACRNNPFATQRALNNGGLAAVNAPKGTFIAFATAPDQCASDGTGSNGLYTSQLVKNITKEGATIEQVFKSTRNDVYNISNKSQIPWENSSIFGDFYFKK